MEQRDGAQEEMAKKLEENITQIKEQFLVLETQQEKQQKNLESAQV